MVTPGQMLVTLYNPKRMQLVAGVRESLRNRLQIGQSIGVQVEGMLKQCSGTISEIVPEAQSASRSFQVKVTGPCPAGIYSGMFGRILIPLEEEEVLVIPRRAVHEVGQLALVEVFEQGHIVRRTIRIGRVFGGNVEVISGLRRENESSCPRRPGHCRRQPVTEQYALPAEPQHGFTNRIVKIFLESNLSIILILLASIVGLAALGLTPREEDPQIVVPLADVYVSFPGHSASEVEQLVATPLEKILYQIDGVEYVYSMSRENQAIITVRYYVGEDRERSLVKLYKKIDENVDIVPPGVTGWVVKPVEIDDVPVATLTLTAAAAGDRRPVAGESQSTNPKSQVPGSFSNPQSLIPDPSPDDMTLRRVAEELTQRLAGVKDVSRAYVVGGRPRVVQVLMDPDAMTAHHVSPLELQRAIQTANVRLSAGDFRNKDRLIRVEAGEPFSSARQLRDLVVGVFDGRPVFLKDVARVEDGPEEVGNYVRHGWGPARGFTKHEFFPGTVLGEEQGLGIGNSELENSEGDSPIFVERKLGQSPTNSFLLRKTLVGCVLARTNMDLPQNQVRASTHPTDLKPSATETNSFADPNASSPAVTIAIAKKKGANAVWVANAVFQEAEKLQKTIVPSNMELVVTRNYGLTADEKVNELVEALAAAVIIVVALLTLGLGWRRGSDCGGRRARGLRADPGDQPDARIYDQSRHVVCDDSLAGAIGGRSDRRCRKHRPAFRLAQKSDSPHRSGSGGRNPPAVDYRDAGGDCQLFADVFHHRNDGAVHAADGAQRARDHAHVDAGGVHDHALVGLSRA